MGTVTRIARNLNNAKKNKLALFGKAASVKTEELLRMSLSPKGMCPGWTEEKKNTYDKKGDLTVPYKIGGETAEGKGKQWEFKFDEASCNQEGQCSSHNECCTKRCEGLKIEGPTVTKKGKCMKTCATNKQDCENS